MCKTTLGFLAALIVAIALGLACSPSQAGIILQDDFNDGVISPAMWQVAVQGGGIVEEAGGVLSMSASSGPPTSQGKMALGTLVGGDLDVLVGYEWIEFGGTPRARTQLFITSQDGTQRVQLNGNRSGLGLDESWLGFYHTKDNVTVTMRGWILNQPLSGRLRIRRDGATYYGYYATPTGDWQSLGSLIAFDGPVIIDFNDNNAVPPGVDPTYPSFEVHWDNFQVTADWVVPEPTTLSLLTMCGLGLLARRRRRAGTPHVREGYGSLSNVVLRLDLPDGLVGHVVHIGATALAQTRPGPSLAPRSSYAPL